MDARAFGESCATVLISLPDLTTTFPLEFEQHRARGTGQGEEVVLVGQG